jgi:hypothetical protein
MHFAPTGCFPQSGLVMRPISTPLLARDTSLLGLNSRSICGCNYWLPGHYPPSHFYFSETASHCLRSSVKKSNQMGPMDRLCGLVVRVLGRRSRDPRYDSRRYHIFWEVVGLEQSPLSLVRINDELFEWKSSVSGSRESRLTTVGIRCADYATPSFGKRWN